MEPGEVDIAPVHDVKAASFEGDPVENADVVELAVGNVDEGRNVAPQAEQRMELDRAFVFTEARPRKQRQAQVDGGRVERISRVSIPGRSCPRHRACGSSGPS